jgi:cell wall-associated NlpC family hydrolase
MPAMRLPPVRNLVVSVAAFAWLAGCAARGPAPRTGPERAPAPTPPAARVEPPPPSEGLPHGLSELLRRVLETAVRLVGTPYRAGGANPSTGFDCSGFVTWVFGAHGLAVPRTVRDQFSAARGIPDGSGPAAGDLLFFSTEGPGPTHVGIALGDGRFVHAPSSRGVVRIEPLQAPYWSRRYLGARRLIPLAASPAPAPPPTNR